MHVQTHIMSGWCVGNLFALNPRERLFCMFASAFADLDGLTLAFGWDAYRDYHHVLGHNLPFAILLTTALTIFSTHRLKAATIYFSLFHLHLGLDYFGSGPLWKIYYLWPFSNWSVMYRGAWEFFSWQNISTAIAFLAWTIWIAVRHGRTPLEAIMPGLDRQLVDWLRAKLTRGRNVALATAEQPGNP